MKLGQIIANLLNPRDPGYYRVTELNRINGKWMFVAYPMNDFCLCEMIEGAL